MLGHLRERLHTSVSKSLRDAWDLDSADRAARVLEGLAGSLADEHPGAAASIRVGLEETLTVQRLDLTGTLRRTLRTTNTIENLMGAAERYTSRVKRWRGGERADGGGAAFPAGPGLLRPAPPGQGAARAGPPDGAAAAAAYRMGDLGGLRPSLP